MSRFYKRENYLQRIRGFYYQNDIIKVITGVRRCGKSCLMRTIQNELLEAGISEDRIIYLDLDQRGFLHITTPEQLEKIIDSHVKDDGNYFLFIDEIQNVKNFEPLINSYRNEGHFSIFLTGSNSYLLSGELVTKLTGRYIEIDMLPLTFEEYLDMKRFHGKTIDLSLTNELNNYILEGGFPKTIELDDFADKRVYVQNLIQEILKKDIQQRIKIRNIAAFNVVQTYFINNFGMTTSLSNMLEDLKKVGLDIKPTTLQRYITILKDAKILYECDRFDLKSRKSIRGEQKYYLSDLSFYFATNTDNRISYGPVLENIIYTYALSKNYQVSIGRIGKLECDFILRNRDLDYRYVQVAMTINADKSLEDREYRSLEGIRDNYPKYVMTLDSFLQKRNGIIHERIPDFLADGKLF